MNNMPITEDFPGLTGNSFLWDTDVLAGKHTALFITRPLALLKSFLIIMVPAGTVMTMKLTDATGVTAFSAPVVVQNSRKSVHCSLE